MHRGSMLAVTRQNLQRSKLAVTWRAAYWLLSAVCGSPAECSKPALIAVSGMWSKMRASICCE